MHHHRIMVEDGQASLPGPNAAHPHGLMGEYLNDSGGERDYEDYDNVDGGQDYYDHGRSPSRQSGRHNPNPSSGRANTLKSQYRNYKSNY